MFKNTRTNPGLAGLLAVALVIAGYLAGAGLVLKTYVEAGGVEQPQVTAPEQCRVVCAPAAEASDTAG
jgi:hypothetical protein